MGLRRVRAEHIWPKRSRVLDRIVSHLGNLAEVSWNLLRLLLYSLLASPFTPRTSMVPAKTSQRALRRPHLEGAQCSGLRLRRASQLLCFAFRHTAPSRTCDDSTPRAATARPRHLLRAILGISPAFGTFALTCCTAIISLQTHTEFCLHNTTDVAVVAAAAPSLARCRHLLNRQLRLKSECHRVMHTFSSDHHLPCSCGT